MEFIYTDMGVELVCCIECEEIDCFSHSSGHYTKPGDFFVESVTHKGVDITHLISEDVTDTILEEFKKSL